MKHFKVIGLLVIISLGVNAQPHKPTPDFSSTGNIHKEVIQIWESYLKNYYSQYLQKGLIENGNVYILYNMQEFLQSFVEMTRRCKDVQQINELTQVINPVFGALRPNPKSPDELGWICTGGGECTVANHLLGNEVQLCSAQFLGLLGALATTITETIPIEKRTQDEKIFLTNSFNTMASQVNFWLSPAYFEGIKKRLAMTPEDVKNGASNYFFEDRDLWFMTTLSDLSELYQSGIIPTGSYAKTFRTLRGKVSGIAALFDLFVHRTSIFKTSIGNRAELDRGYWRLYFDNRFALYEGKDAPLSCEPLGNKQWKKTVQVPWNSSFIDPNMGWDISHSRRLVPALETFERNQKNIAKVYGYRNPAFDPTALATAYANQIVAKIWNHDRKYPLFKNYWDGSNGWYRVGYNNGTGSCDPGYPPFYLTTSIPDCGYPQWGTFNQTLHNICLTFYNLIQSDSIGAKSFISKYYSAYLMPKTKGEDLKIHNIWWMSFLSSMVNE